jgi:hypothetical protein
MAQMFARMDHITNNLPPHIDYNHQGMRGKLTIPFYSGFYDGEKYFDWKMDVEQEFNSHQVPEKHKVKYATREFKDFAQFWWRELGNLHQQPQSWDRLKEAMHDHFIPLSYKHKMQRLEQGNMSVQEYYVEFQKCAICCEIEEDLEDKVCRFYSGLRCEIQDIVYYKDFNTINQLFQLAMLAEKELQGHQQKN